MRACLSPGPAGPTPMARAGAGVTDAGLPARGPRAVLREGAAVPRRSPTEGPPSPHHTGHFPSPGSGAGLTIPGLWAPGKVLSGRAWEAGRQEGPGRGPCPPPGPPSQGCGEAGVGEKPML